MTTNITNNPFQFNKGDIIGGAGPGLQPLVIPVGANTTVLTADNTQPSGLSWTPKASGGSGTVMQRLYVEGPPLVDPNFPPTTGIPRISISTSTNASPFPYSQGTEILSVTITPTSLTSVLHISCFIYGFAAYQNSSGSFSILNPTIYVGRNDFTNHLILGTAAVNGTFPSSFLTSAETYTTSGTIAPIIISVKASVSTSYSGSPYYLFIWHPVNASSFVTPYYYYGNSDQSKSWLNVEELSS